MPGGYGGGVGRRPQPCLCSGAGLDHRGFPDSSVGKESICNAGNPSLIPGSGRSPGEGKGYPNILSYYPFIDPGFPDGAKW